MASVGIFMVALSLVQALVVAAINSSVLSAIIAGVFLTVNTALTIFLTEQRKSQNQDRPPRWRRRPDNDYEDGVGDDG